MTACFALLASAKPAARLVRRRMLHGPVAAALLAAAGASVWAQPAAEAGAPAAATAARSATANAASAGKPAASGPTAPRQWVAVPRVFGRLRAADLGLVINTADPYSIEVGEYYIRARGLQPQQVLRVSLPLAPAADGAPGRPKSVLSRDEFDELTRRIGAHFGSRTQALALAWSRPYAVECNAITGALTLGFDEALCKRTGGPPSRASRYFNSPSAQPYTDLRIRPSMLLAARDAASAKALIDRGVASDGTLGATDAPPVNVHFVATRDTVRSQRELLFPPAGRVAAYGLEVHLDRTDALIDADRVLMYLTGAARVDRIETVRFVPGALADHLTSWGGNLDQPHGQMTVLSWIDVGVTASYGTVSEPYSHLQKFPHPQVLLLHYVQGASAIEAYWKSVAWPQQGLFVGEPLAAPFAPPGS